MSYLNDTRLSSLLLLRLVSHRCLVSAEPDVRVVTYQQIDIYSKLSETYSQNSQYTNHYFIWTICTVPNIMCLYQSSATSL